MNIQTQEAQIILAIEAICMSKNLKPYCAAKIYNMPEQTLCRRIAGIPSCTEFRPTGCKLTNLEEEVLIERILDLDSRGFSPGLAGVEDMANYILQSQGGKHVGKL